MDHKNSSVAWHDSAFSQLVEKACRHWEARRMAVEARTGSGLPTPPAFAIALAREAGTQGTAIGQEVSKRLGWHVYDHELLEQIARDMGLRTNLLETVDEKHIGWLQECVR